MAEPLITEVRRLIGSPAYARHVAEAPCALGPLRRPATAAEVDQAQEALGLALPPLLRRIYQEVAGGGLYLGFPLLGVPTDEAHADGPTIVSVYPGTRHGAEEREPGLFGYRVPGPDAPNAFWPRNLVALTAWQGDPQCAVLCDRPEFPVAYFDPPVDYRYIVYHLGGSGVLFPGAEQVRGGAWIQWDSFDEMIEDWVRHLHRRYWQLLK